MDEETTAHVAALEAILAVVVDHLAEAARARGKSRSDFYEEMHQKALVHLTGFGPQDQPRKASGNLDFIVQSFRDRPR